MREILQHRDPVHQNSERNAIIPVPACDERSHQLRSSSGAPRMKDSEYDVMARVEAEHWWYVSLHRLVIDQIAPVGKAVGILSMADAGCGTGGLFQAIGRTTHRVDYVGFDLETRALEHSRRRGAGKLVRASVNELPLAPRSVDAIVSLDVLCVQGVDVARALAGFREALRPGGMLMLNLPAFDVLRGRHDVAVSVTRRFRRRDVEAMLGEAGLEAVRISYWNATTFLPLAVWRWLSRVAGRDDARSDLTLPLGWMNPLMKQALRVEAAVGRRVRLPFGSSVFAVARRPSD